MMNYHVFFSPTGGTERVVRYAAKEFPGEGIDLSREISQVFMTGEDFAIVAVPSFGGRVPQIAAKGLESLRGQKTPALLLVTYGARAYEDTLRELKDILNRQGFVCVGAAALITPHSIVPAIGADRPNAEDWEKLDAFLLTVKNQLEGEGEEIQVPGNFPYKEYRVLPMEIQTGADCVSCGLCAEKCPVHAIPRENPGTTDLEKCISCMRCVHICPQKARGVNPERLAMLREKLEKICEPNRDIEFF